MSVSNYAELAEHVGHNIEVVGYGGGMNPVVEDGVPGESPPKIHHERVYANVAIECEDCSVVLLDFDHPDVAGEIGQ